MLRSSIASMIALDVPTLFVIATCVTALLGAFLLFAWMQDRIRALAWWGCAYLMGGFSVALWSVESAVSPPLPAGSANALLFVACGMIWTAARLFHGRRVLWTAMGAGAVVWLVACTWQPFNASVPARIVLSSIIIASYTFLTAMELWRERRKRLQRRWPAVFVPLLHGAVFLAPMPLAAVLPDDGNIVNLASGWVAVFALEVILYIVGTAFIVLVLTKEQAVRIHKHAAATDDLTGLLNRRGFLDAARSLIAGRPSEPVSLLMFDLDHFKAINDRFGHAAGDAALRLFAATLETNMRASDLVGRIGGEEFAAVLPGSIDEAATAAERVRLAFESAGTKIAGYPVCATVSVGMAGGVVEADVLALLARADVALYRAKANGRNRVEGDREEADAASPPVQEAAAMQGVAFWQVDPEPQVAQPVS